MPAPDRSFAFIQIGGNLLPGFKSLTSAGRILPLLILYQNVQSGRLAIKGMPLMPVDLPAPPPEADLYEDSLLYAADRDSRAG